MAKKRTIYWTAAILVIVGGLNWGLIGIFNFDVVEKILGWAPVLQKTVYTLVGIAAICMVYYLIKRKRF